jgi:hypothetical protein
MPSGMSVRVLFAAKHHFTMDTTAISILISHFVTIGAGALGFSMTTTPIFSQPTAGSFIGFCFSEWNYRLLLEVA